MNDSMHINTEKIAQLSFAFLMNMIILFYVFGRFLFYAYFLITTTLENVGIRNTWVIHIRGFSFVLTKI